MSEPLRPELEAKAQELAARIKARSADAILEMARRLVATTDDTLFGDTEFALRDQAQGIVADAYAGHLPQKVATPPPPSTAPTAGRSAPFHGYREKTVETLGGAVTCNRAYYYCGLCGQRLLPLGRASRIDRRSVSRRRWNDWPRSAGRWPTASRREPNCLQETAGIRLSESTVQRTTEATGQRIAEHLQKGRTFGGKQAWDWFRDACGRTRGLHRDRRDRRAAAGTKRRGVPRVGWRMWG